MAAYLDRLGAGGVPAESFRGLTGAEAAERAARELRSRGRQWDCADGGRGRP